MDVAAYIIKAAEADAKRGILTRMGEALLVAALNASYKS